MGHKDAGPAKNLAPYQHTKKHISSQGGAGSQPSPLAGSPPHAPACCTPQLDFSAAVAPPPAVAVAPAAGTTVPTCNTIAAPRRSVQPALLLRLLLLRPLGRPTPLSHIRPAAAGQPGAALGPLRAAGGAGAGRGGEVFRHATRGPAAAIHSCRRPFSQGYRHGTRKMLWSMPGPAFASIRPVQCLPMAANGSQHPARHPHPARRRGPHCLPFSGPPPTTLRTAPQPLRKSTK